MGRIMNRRLHLGRSKARWLLHATWERLGYPELLVLVLAGLLASLFFTVLRPLQIRGAVLDQAITALRTPGAPPLTPEPESGKAGAAISSLPQDFLAFLPPVSQRERQLRQLHDLATALHLTMGKVQYAPLAIAHLPVDGLTIKLDLQGEDRALRLYLHQLLQAQPALAVRSLEIGHAPDSGLQTLSLDLALYNRREGGDAP